MSKKPVSEEVCSTAHTRDHSLAYYEQSAGRDEQFFLFFSLPDTHHPLNPPSKYWDM